MGDDNYIFVQLEFPTVDGAQQFKAFLESVVWQSQDLSPRRRWNTARAGPPGGVPSA